MDYMQGSAHNNWEWCALTTIFTNPSKKIELMKCSILAKAY
jgi:hypothetical protein